MPEFGYYNINSLREVSDFGYCSFYGTGLVHPSEFMCEHDLVYMLEGSWEIYHGDTAYTIYPDDVLLLHAQQHIYGLTQCPPGTKTVYLHLSAHPNDFLYQEQAPESMPNTHFSGDIARVDTLIHCQGDVSVKALFHDVISAKWSSSEIKNFEVSHLCNLLLCKLHNISVEHSTSKSSMALEAARIIQTSPQVFFTAEMLAKQLHVGERTLRNNFQDYYNQTIYSYQLNIKLHMACHFLIKHPMVTLQETAASFGFYDASHLAKQFKKKYGSPPAQYVKAYRTKNDKPQ